MDEGDEDDGERPLPPLRPGLVRPARTRRPGEEADGPTLNQARGPRWRRTARGWYVPADVSEDDVEQRIVEASVHVPDGGAVTGWASLRWRGGRWFSGLRGDGSRRPVPLLVGTHDVRKQPGLLICGEHHAQELYHWVDGVRVADARAAVSFEMRYARSPLDAALVLSMAAFNDLVSVAEVAAFLTPGQNSWTGVPQARKAVPLAGENYWSPPEFLVARTWVDSAGLPAPLANAPVFDLRGRHLFTPDLIDPEAGVAVEYNGDVHLTREQAHTDARRTARVAAVGIESVTALAPDLRDPAAFVRDLHAAYRRAERNAGRRGWTLEKPAWWTPTETVEQRRALTDEQRARWLGHRAS